MWERANQIDLRKLQLSENKFQDLSSGKIAYKDIGEGRVMFCIPPWPSSSTVFVPLAEATKHELRIITPDIPGWGGYSDKLSLRPTIENFTEVLAEFISSFGITDYDILGYSFGGVFVQSLLKKELIKPQKTVFVSSIHSGDDLIRENKNAVQMYRMLKRLMIPSSAIKQLVSLIVGRISRRNKYAIYEHYYDTQIYQNLYKEDMMCDIDSIFGAILSLEKEELLNGNTLKSQSLVIYADTDPEFIKKGSRELASFLEVEPLYLEGVDHDHFVFDVNKSADFILNFLLA